MLHWRAIARWTLRGRSASDSLWQQSRFGRRRLHRGRYRRRCDQSQGGAPRWPDGFRTQCARHRPFFFETKRQALSWANTHPAFTTVQVFPPNYVPATIAQRSQLSKQPAPKVAAGTVPQRSQLSKQRPGRRNWERENRAERAPRNRSSRPRRSRPELSRSYRSSQPRRSRPELSRSYRSSQPRRSRPELSRSFRRYRNSQPEGRGRNCPAASAAIEAASPEGRGRNCPAASAAIEAASPEGRGRNYPAASAAIETASPEGRSRNCSANQTDRRRKSQGRT